MIEVKKIIIKTPNFTLRTLDTNDNLDLYLSWMRDVTNNEFILTCRKNYSLEDLRLFIERNNSLPDAMLLGIFEDKTKKHIGNIKYSNINQITKSAEMGILIGQTEWRGKNVGQEVILWSIKWLQDQFGIKKVTLGVDLNNLAAIKLYYRLGFIRVKHHGPKRNGMIMELTLSS